MKKFQSEALDVPSWEPTYPMPRHFEDIPFFPQVGYVGPLEGIQSRYPNHSLDSFNHRSVGQGDVLLTAMLNLEHTFGLPPNPGCQSQMKG